MSNCMQLEIQPRDVFFFRDAKPLGGADAGTGGKWPLPSVFHSALMGSFYDKWPEYQDFEHEHHWKEGFDKNKRSNCRFGGLKTAGPFPCKTESIYMPLPADIKFDDTDLSDTAKLIQLNGFSSDMPEFIKYGVVNYIMPSKKKDPEWISSKDFMAYLEGKRFQKDSQCLYETEPKPGIGINNETHSTEESRFYKAEYLRLAKDVSMAVFAECESISHSESGKSSHSIFKEFFKDDKSIPFIFGGQRGLATIKCSRTANTLESFSCAGDPVCHGEHGYLLKWTLISPAIFTTGWLPNWISGANGKVLLKKDDIPRQDFEDRQTWREKIRALPEINAYLVAARLNKAFPVSGWSMHGGEKEGPKPGMLAVPAGSVYYFKAETKEDAVFLERQLSHKRRSDFFGEKGFGIGICSFKNIEIENI